MKTIDLGAYFVIYNLVIGVLLMLASEKLGSYAGYLGGNYSDKLTRYTRLSCLTFGSTVAVISATIYIVVHTLRIGVA